MEKFQYFIISIIFACEKTTEIRRRFPNQQKTLKHLTNNGKSDSDWRRQRRRHGGR